jgi:hypothetical protein
MLGHRAGDLVPLAAGGALELVDRHIATSHASKRLFCSTIKAPVAVSGGNTLAGEGCGIASLWPRLDAVGSGVCGGGEIHHRSLPLGQNYILRPTAAPHLRLGRDGPWPETNPFG